MIQIPSLYKLLVLSGRNSDDPTQDFYVRSQGACAGKGKQVVLRLQLSLFVTESEIKVNVTLPEHSSGK
jgi:hypothetical protein